MKVHLEIIETKISQDKVVDLPDDIYKQGRQRVIDYLWRTGEIDNALDHSETETDIKLWVEDE